MLKEVTLELEGGVVAVAGPNGSGKTTLLRTLATLLRPSSGHVEIAGSDIGSRAGAAEARRHLGFLPQDPAYLEHLRVREIVVYAAWLHRISRARRDAAVQAALDDLDLLDVAETPLRKLSGGTRRRAYIAQALVHRPPVLLLDEPTVGLDPDHRVELRRLIRRLAPGRLVLLTTHLTEDVELLPDRVVVIVDGTVRFQGTPSELVALAPPRGGTGDERPVERALRVVAGRPLG
ncbi:MAG TPA: ATP-binding cassette domain-containing protein [Actinomycetota bacterium]|nr:ATP-binding cassette domain-containing protein [Actinomycetota bacterium]